MLGNSVSIFLILLLCLGLTVNTGCYGPCKVTGAVAGWHSDLDTNKYAKEAIFLPIFIFVYPITAFVDYFILNSIEWWTMDDGLED